jgi:hypothetical protein
LAAGWPVLALQSITIPNASKAATQKKSVLVASFMRGTRVMRDM